MKRLLTWVHGKKDGINKLIVEYLKVLNPDCDVGGDEVAEYAVNDADGNSLIVSKALLKKCILEGASRQRSIDNTGSPRWIINPAAAAKFDIDSVSPFICVIQCGLTLTKCTTV
jgi:hypothetical protein